ncbi:hypothetical protein [Roseicyclus elongatus]|uniref:hypothetical protein n=1 Tax=Roseicyclus elongatus TaxID=159346 RepID=UPI0005710B1D|nr:hypothetical protein [Roseibacterium elongatum]
MADEAEPSAGRLRAAFALSIAGALSLFAALMGHEFFVFGGQGHDLIEPSTALCAAPPCLTVEVVVSGQVAKAIGAAMAFAIIGVIWVQGRSRMLIGAGFWTLQFCWSLVGVASGYRLHFGTDWGWWEPFARLMWHPLVTPGLLVAGLAAFLGLDRVLRPIPHRPAA